MAATMSVMTPILTTTTTTKTSTIPPFSHSSSLAFINYSIIRNSRTSRRRTKHIEQFQLKSSSPTDINLVLDYSATDVVRMFYEGINARDLSTVVDLIAEDCVYEDLVFPQPIIGRKAILDFFEKFIYTISKDLQFCIDDISGEDTSAVGVTWHLEWKGKPFPFSKGCSFYRLKLVDGSRKIVYGRDIVEPAVKPGDFALVAIRGVTWLLEQFPQLAERF